MPSSFISSHFNNVDKLSAIQSATVFAADLTSANLTTAPHRVRGSGCTLTTKSVITPNVPSAPRYNAFNSYPVLDFLVSARVRIIAPLGVTTVIDRTFSLLVPYLSVDNPLPPVLAIPPMLGLLLGSGPNTNPNGFNAALSSLFNTPAPTRATPSPRSTPRTSIAFMRDVSMTHPPA